MLTKIKTLDKYLESIGGSEDNIVAIWETGSYLDGIADDFSDRDFGVIWETKAPNSAIRAKNAQKLGFDVHEIKDVSKIGMSFDMFFDGKHRINIGHGTKDKERKWYEALYGQSLPSDLEEILMSIYALKRGEIYYQKNGWVDKLIKKVDLTPEIKERIVRHYTTKISKALKLLEKATNRNDFLQFIHYLEKVLRPLQIIYLIKNDKPVVSSKFFEKRFGKIENGEISKLIREIDTQLDMEDIYSKTIKLASTFDVEQSEKYTA